MSRLVAVLAALGIARLLPEHGAGLYLRLGAATLALVWPFAGRGAAEALAWSLGALFLALLVTFLVHGSLGLALILFAVLAVAAAAVRAPRFQFGYGNMLARWDRRGRGREAGAGLVLLAGLGFGIALWHVAGGVQGDALFHLARVRKLDDFGSLSLHAVDEFRDGGLHPGYAFPLWHGFLALVARLGGVDPTAVVQHESSLLAPVLFLVTYEAGRELFRSAWLGAATLAAQLGLTALAAGHGGALVSLDLPASASQLLLAPAVLALLFRAVDEPSRARYAALVSIALALALTHPTYALFLLIPLGGFLVARALLAGRDLRELAGTLVAVTAPTAGVLLWLLPIVRQTARTDVGVRHGLPRYPGQFDVCGPHCFRLAPELIDRRGAVAVAALALVPLAGLARRTRWAAFVLGGTLALLLLVLWPRAFVHFTHLVSVSQSRRVVGFLPLAFALAGGAAVLARLSGPLVLPLGLAAGIWLQLAYPGDFGYVFRHGGPAIATWVALIGGAAALVLVALLRRPDRIERRGVLAGFAALLFVLPVAVHGFSRWSPPPGGGQELTPGLVQALRAEVPRRAVVFSDVETSYRAAAYAPVYIAAAPPAHVADTKANRPYRREADAKAFFRTGSLAIPRRYGASYLLVDRRHFRLRPPLEVVYADGRYTLYRLKQASA